MLSQADRKTAWRNHQSSLAGTGILNSVCTVGVVEALCLQKFICFIKVVNIHSDDRHILWYWCSSDRDHMTFAIFQYIGSDIVVGSEIFLVLFFKTEINEKINDIFDVWRNDHCAEIGNFHVLIHLFIS